MNTITIVVESRYRCSDSTYVSYVIELLTSDKDEPLYDDDGNLIEYNKDCQLFGYDEDDNFVPYTKYINHSTNMKKTYTLYAKLKYMLANQHIFTTDDMENLKDLIASYKIIDGKLPANYHVVDEYC